MMLQLACNDECMLIDCYKNKFVYCLTCMRRHALLCYAMLCFAVLCYAMLCYAILYYAMLYYAMLCYAMHVNSLCNTGMMTPILRTLIN
jgi:hypothetical protein